MTIETKYNLGQEVWMHLSNRCICGKIIDVRAYTSNKRKMIVYELFVEDECISMLEKHLFPTKEELLKSL